MGSREDVNSGRKVVMTRYFRTQAIPQSRPVAPQTVKRTVPAHRALSFLAGVKSKQILNPTPYTLHPKP